MKNLRSSVFETNSSSTHSIAITPNTDGIYSTIEPKDGVIVLNGGDFGWGWEKFNDALTKANYCAEHTKYQNQAHDMLVKVIKEHTGAREVIVNPQGYIDHESVGTCGEAFKNEATLKDFIFNDGSWLFIGNDNIVEPPNFTDLPGTVYKYVLALEGKQFFFTTLPSKKEIVNGLFSILEHNRSNNFEMLHEWENQALHTYSKFDEGKVLLFKKSGYYPNIKILKTKELAFELNPL